MLLKIYGSWSQANIKGNIHTELESLLKNFSACSKYHNIFRYFTIQDNCSPLAPHCEATNE